VAHKVVVSSTVCDGLQVPVQQQMMQGPMQSTLQQQPSQPLPTDELAHQEHFQDLKVCG